MQGFVPNMFFATLVTILIFITSMVYINDTNSPSEHFNGSNINDNETINHLYHTEELHPLFITNETTNETVILGLSDEIFDRHSFLMENCGEIIDTVRNTTANVSNLVNNYSLSTKCRQYNEDLLFTIDSLNASQKYPDTLRNKHKHLLSTNNTLLAVPIYSYYVGDEMMCSDNNLLDMIKSEADRMCNDLPIIMLEILARDRLKLTPTIHIALETLISTSVCYTKCATQEMEDSLKESFSKIQKDYAGSWHEFDEISKIEMFISSIGANHSTCDDAAEKEFAVSFNFSKNETESEFN